MNYYVGLDVSLRSVALCIVNCEGDIILERSLDCEVDAIDACLRKFAQPIIKLDFEAGVMSQTLFYGLKSLGYDAVCMEARQVNAALSAMRNKTDKNDARGIAQVVRSGWYQPVHMKSRESHYIRLCCASVSILRTKFAAYLKLSASVCLEPCPITALTIPFVRSLKPMKDSPSHCFLCWKPATLCMSIFENWINV